MYALPERMLWCSRKCCKVLAKWFCMKKMCLFHRLNQTSRLNSGGGVKVFHTKTQTRTQ